MKKLLFTSLMLGIFPVAHAGLLVEPVVGWTFGQKLDIPTVKNYSGGQGASYGGRLGYQRGPFQIGADYLKSSVAMDSSNFNKNVDLEELGAFVGFEFPVLFRAYAGYMASIQGDTKINGDKTELNNGTGYKLGLGFTLLPILDINLEYRTGSFDDFKQGGVKVNKQVDYQAYMIGLSAPFDLF